MATSISDLTIHESDNTKVASALNNFAAGDAGKALEILYAPATYSVLTPGVYIIQSVAEGSPSYATLDRACGTTGGYGGAAKLYALTKPTATGNWSTRTWTNGTPAAGLAVDLDGKDVTLDGNVICDAIINPAAGTIADDGTPRTITGDVIQCSTTGIFTSAALTISGRLVRYGDTSTSGSEGLVILGTGALSAASLLWVGSDTEWVHPDGTPYYDSPPWLYFLDHATVTISGATTIIGDGVVGVFANVATEFTTGTIAIVGSDSAAAKSKDSWCDCLGAATVSGEGSAPFFGNGGVCCMRGDVTATNSGLICKDSIPDMTMGETGGTILLGRPISGDAICRLWMLAMPSTELNALDNTGSGTLFLLGDGGLALPTDWNQVVVFPARDDVLATKEHWAFQLFYGGAAEEKYTIDGQATGGVSVSRSALLGGV